MTVTVEVPDGCKFCKGCGLVKPIEKFAMTYRKLADGTIVYYRKAKCGGCRNAPAKTPAAPLWKRPPYERACDIAFTQWQGGTPRQDWRVAI